MTYPNENEKHDIGPRGAVPKVRIVTINEFDYNDMKKAEDVYRIELPYEYVTEALENQIDYWNKEESIFIAADTGLGKNTFIETCLIPYVRGSGGKILFLTNRVALGRQEKRRLASIFHMEDKLNNYTDQGLDELTEFGCLTVVSYQQLESWLRYHSSKIKDIEKAKFEFVVMDEVHYFMADSCFNALTDKSLAFLTQRFREAIRIYMTATPYEIFPYLKQIDLRIRLNEYGEEEWFPRKWLLYEFAHDYSWIQLYAFDTELDLIDIVNRSDGKWLIFVNSIRMGQELQTQLDGSVVITAESKKQDNETNSQFLQVVKNESFNERVIITTAVLENGVNIKDYYVKNVAIFSNDKIQFLQMLGRVRRLPGSRLDVYIPNADKDSIGKWKQSCYNGVKAADLFERSPAEFYDSYINAPTPIVNVKGIFTVLWNGDTVVNSLYKIKRGIYDLPFWQAISEKYKNGEKNALLIEKFSWLEKEFKPENIAGRKQFQAALRELDAFLAEYEGKRIDKEEKESFSERFTLLWKKAFGKRKEDKTDDQNYGAAIIKKLLEQQKLGYQLKTEKDGWILVPQSLEE